MIMSMSRSTDSIVHWPIYNYVVNTLILTIIIKLSHMFNRRTHRNALIEVNTCLHVCACVLRGAAFIALRFFVLRYLIRQSERVKSAN